MSNIWDIASLVLKILAVAAAIAGIALPILDAVNVKLVELTRGQLVSTVLVFAAVAFLFGAADYVIGKRSEQPPSPVARAGDGGISLHLSDGSRIGNIKDSFNRIERQINILPGDSQQDRERKKKLAEHMVAEGLSGQLRPWTGALISSTKLLLPIRSQCSTMR